MHIQLLEEEFQVKLFERLGHKIKITQQGEQLLYYAEKILAFSEEVKFGSIQEIYEQIRENVADVAFFLQKKCNILI